MKGNCILTVRTPCMQTKFTVIQHFITLLCFRRQAHTIKELPKGRANILSLQALNGRKHVIILYTHFSHNIIPPFAILGIRS